MTWNQERPDELWVGQRNEPNQIILKDPSLLMPRRAAMPICRAATAKATTTRTSSVPAVLRPGGDDPSAPIEYPTFEDGYRMMKILEKAIESAKKRGWVEV